MQATMDHRLRHRAGWGAFLVLSSLFLAAYLLILAGAGLHENTDTALYRELARQDLNVAWFAANRRPPLYPLIIRLFAGDIRLVAGMQVLAYLGAWLGLARLFQRELLAGGRPWASTQLVGATYYLALYPGFAGWNHVILTESLSITGQVVLTTLLTRIVLRGRGRDAVLLACLCLLLMLLRDAGTFVALAMILPLGLAAVRGRVRGVAFAAAAIIMVGGACLSTWSADRVGGGTIDSACSDDGAPAFAPRWVFPMLDTIGRRILPDPAAAEFFRERGMVLDTALLAMSGDFAFGGARRWDFYCNPSLQPFRTWLLAHGRSTYALYLLTHPDYGAATLWADRADVFQAFDYRLSPYPDTRFQPGLPKRERQHYDDSVPPHLPLIIAYGCAGLTSLWLVVSGFLRRRRARLDAGLVCTGALAMLVPLALVFDLGDSMEPARHCVLIPLQGALVALMGSFFCLWERQRSPQSTIPANL